VGRVMDVGVDGRGAAAEELRRLCWDAGKVRALSEAVRLAGAATGGAKGLGGGWVPQRRGGLSPWCIRDPCKDPVDALVAAPANAVGFNQAATRAQPGQQTRTYATRNLWVRDAQGRRHFDGLVLPFVTGVARAVEAFAPDVWRAWEAVQPERWHGLPIRKVTVNRNVQTPLHADSRDRSHAALLVLHDVDDAPPSGGQLIYAGLRLHLGHASLLLFDATEPHCNLPIVAQGFSARISINMTP